MVMRIGGLRRKTRYKFRKKAGTHGKISLTRYFQSFKEGDKVFLGVESAVQRGMYHPRFFGKVGTVKGKRGRCYEVLIKDVRKEKTLVVHPIHMKKAGVLENG